MFNFQNVLSKNSAPTKFPSQTKKRSDTDCRLKGTSYKRKRIYNKFSCLLFGFQ